MGCVLVDYSLLYMSWTPFQSGLNAEFQLVLFQETGKCGKSTSVAWDSGPVSFKDIVY